MHIFIRFTAYAVLSVFLFGAGCSPLVASEGWKFLRSQDPAHLDEAIRKDYQDYIQKLSSKERKAVGSIFLFEDRTGRHAVTIEVGLNYTYWTHVLIYDRENRRMKVVKYVSGHWMS
jgi:hypothetical protein